MHCTFVVPRANVEPEAGVQFTVPVPSTRSVAVAVNVTLAPEGLVASAVKSAGRCEGRRRGVDHGYVERTARGLIEEFVALQLTVVVPSGKVEPGRRVADDRRVLVGRRGIRHDRAGGAGRLGGEVGRQYVSVGGPVTTVTVKCRMTIREIVRRFEQLTTVTPGAESRA